jgi:hypothetical protein
MSLLGNDMSGTASINGLNNVNANNVYSDDIYIDYSTNPINVGDALMALDLDVATLQSEMNAVEADVITLQSEMNAVEADVATLQSEMNAVEADVVTLQSDVTALTISTGVTAATVAGLVISQAAQDVTIASHTVSISALQAEDFLLDDRIDDLEVKTTDQTWGSLTGTTFSTKVNVGGGSGVVLNTGSASEFNSGIVCSSIASTSATTNIDIGSALTTGDINLGNSAGATGVALNWGGSSNSGNLSFQGGSFTLASTGVYTQRCGPTFDMTIADTQTTGILNLGTGVRTGAINLGTGVSSKNITMGNNTGGGTTLFNGTNVLMRAATFVGVGDSMGGGTINIGRNDAGVTTTTTSINNGSAHTGPINIGSGASAKTITIGSAASTNTINGTTTIAGTANINTTSLSNTNIGNGAAGGNFTVNAAANSITGTTNTILGTTDINVSGTSATSIGNTAGLLAFLGDDINIDGSDITIKTTGSSNGVVNVEGSQNITLLSVVDAVYINNTGVAKTNIGNTTGTISLTGATNTILGTTNINNTGVSNTNIGNTTGLLALKGDDVTIDATDIYLTTTGVDYGVIVLEGSESVTLLSVVDNVYINFTGDADTKIGNTTGDIDLTGATNTILGTTNINNTGVSNTNIGNTTGVTTVTGQATFLGNTQFGDASADAIVPNGTLTKPFIIGTYASQSSYSTTSTTPITTYLGGTLESTKTFTNSATGNFRYIMASVTPFNASGAITLTAGTYMFWLAINFEDASVFNLTDLTMGLTTISTLTSASSEATIIASLPNLTCFFHKTDAGDASASDSEQRVLSSCFNLASSTTVYPFYFANHSVTVDSVNCNTVFVKIGSA